MRAALLAACISAAAGNHEPLEARGLDALQQEQAVLAGLLEGPIGLTFQPALELKPRGPHLAPAWHGQFEGTSGWFGPGKVLGVYAYDSINQRYRSKMSSPTTFYRKDGHWFSDILTANQSGLNHNMTNGGDGRNGVCRPLRAEYGDPFGWLPNSRFQGMKLVRGGLCSNWVYNDPSSNLHSICVDAQGLPREQVLPFAPFGGHQQTLVYTKVSAGIDEEVFAPSYACAANYPARPCPTQNGGTVSLVLDRIHGAQEPPEMVNRNAGDALGDMGFLCSMGFNVSNLVTRWIIEVNSSFGQYGLCTFRNGKNSCYGGDTNLVGRESALGQGEGQVNGQCSENRDVGSWYSFPAAGQCMAGESIGTRGCTWRASRRLRTVSARCILKDRGLAHSCYHEIGHAPFRRSAAIFEAALASNNKEKGGCPDVFAAGEEVFV